MSNLSDPVQLKRLRGLTRYWIFRMFPRPDEAEDIEEEVVLWYLEHPHYEISSWVIRRRVVDEIRKLLSKKRSVVGLVEDIIIQDTFGEDPTNDRDQQDQLNEIMSRIPLSTKERVLVYDHFYKGMTYDEISIRRGMKKSSISRTINLILDRIRKELRNET